MPTKNSRYIKYLFAFGDLALLNFSFIAAYFIKFQTLGGVWVPPYLELWILINVFWTVLIIAFKPYNISRTTTLNSLLKRHLALVVLHLFLITAFWVANKTYYYSRLQLFYSFLIFSFTFSIWRLIFVYSLGILRAKGYNIKRVVIVGGGKLADELALNFSDHPEYGYRVSHTFKQINGSKHYDYYLAEVKEYALENQVKEIYCCTPYLDYKQLKGLVDFGHQYGIKIKLTGNFQGFAVEGFQPESYGSIPVFNITSVPLDVWKNRFMKRCFDIAFSFLVLVFFCAWVFPIIALAIKSSSKGPVLFKQKRTGLNNKVFDCWKFRTMYMNDESDSKQATRNDPRITPIGYFLRKTSLDELPQFINVLLGNMSVVGPRPHPVKLNEYFSPKIRKFHHRHTVKPGITGLAQAKGLRGETTTYEMMNHRVKLDLFYIDKWFFTLDLKIIFLTIISLVRGQENAY